LRKIILVFISFLLFYCGGNSPAPDWTASDFYHAAKEKYDDESYFEAVNEFTVVLLRFAGSTVADSAQYYLADSHYMMGDYLIAGVEYEKLINNMPQSPLIKKAQYRLAESYNELSPRSSLDQKYTTKAIREYQYFVEEFPTDSLKEIAERKITALRNKLGEKEYKNAEIYRKMSEFNAAIVYYDLVLSKYYDTEWADDAQLGKVETYLDAEDVEQANLEAVKFEEQFPESDLKEDFDELKIEISDLQKELARE
jgi:outer membrane protein assembly factor BamD